MIVLLRWILAAAAVVTCAVAADQRPAKSPRAAEVRKRQAPGEGDFTDRSSDGSYAFRYGDRNQFHSAAANKENVVSGRFGSRSPETGRIVQTAYSAGPRGFRARGPDIARQTDLSQVRLPYSPPVPTDSSKYDPAYDRYHDPNEDPSYKFTVRTPTQSKSESADSRGHVEGAYSYLDDVGKRHDVQYEAGAGTGFHVKSAHPDSDPFGGVFYSGPPGKPGGLPRGHTSVVLGKDGSYGFTASGPDQRRSEVSDSNGRVQGSYTYVDDKGVQRTVQYVAGPEIGYRVLNNAAAGGAGAAVVIPSLLQSGGSVVVPPPLLIPSSTPLSPSAFEQDLFGPAASTSAPLPDRRRPEPVKVGGGGSGGGISGVGGFSSGGGSTGFSGSGAGLSGSSGSNGGFSGSGGNGGGFGGSGGNAGGFGGNGVGSGGDDFGSINGGSGGGGGGGTSGEFLSPDSSLPLGSAFPEDDPTLPPKKWPSVYQNKDEQSFFQPFDKLNKRREQNGPKKTYAVPDSSYGGRPAGRPATAVWPDAHAYGHRGQQQHSTTSRPAAVPVDTLYSQPSRPIVVDDKYGQYGGTDYQKPKEHLTEFSHDEGNGNNFAGFPPGTIVKAHVQSLDILPFGHRVPSPSYVLEKQYGTNDGYQNSLKK